MIHGHDVRRVAFTNFMRLDAIANALTLRAPHAFILMLTESENRHNANHYSKRIMQTRYLIKNIFVLARSSLLRADIYRAISYRVVTQNSQLIALIRRDCEHGDGHIYMCFANEFSISRTSPHQGNLRNRALVNYTPRARARARLYSYLRHVSCDIFKQNNE